MGTWGQGDKGTETEGRRDGGTGDRRWTRADWLRIDSGPALRGERTLPTDAARGAAHKGGMRGSSMGAATAVSGV